MKDRPPIRDLRSLSFFLLLSAVYLYPFVRVLWGIRDEGSIVYSAQLVAEGALPYRDFFEVAGPATYYWPALFFKLFGTKLVVSRGLVLITGALSATSIYWMTRRLYRGPYGYLPAIFYLVIGYSNWPVTNHHWDSNFFALLAVVNFLLWNDTGQKRYLIVAGIISGITSCFILQKGFLIFFAFTLVLIFERKWSDGRRGTIINNLGLVSTGYVGVGVFVLVFFYTAGGLSDLLYTSLIYPLKNYHKINVLPYGYGLREWFWPDWQRFANVFLPPLLGNKLAIFFLIPFYIILILPFVVMVLGISLYISVSNRSRFFNSTTLIYSGTGIALWVSELHRMDIMHLIYGSPILLIIFLVFWTTRCEKKRVFYELGVILMLCPLVCFGTVKAFIALSANYQINTRRGLVYSFREDSALKFLHEQIQPGSTVFVYPYYPMYYFLSNVRNPTRFNVLMYHYNSKEHFKEAIAALERKKVKYVLWDTGVSGPNLEKWFPQYTHPPKEILELDNYVEEHYQELEVTDNIRILRRMED